LFAAVAAAATEFHKGARDIKVNKQAIIFYTQACTNTRENGSRSQEILAEIANAITFCREWSHVQRRCFFMHSFQSDIKMQSMGYVYIYEGALLAGKRLLPIPAPRRQLRRRR
jgi:hypothetical protein